MGKTFDEWVKSRQDVRQWSEDELACAQVAYIEAWRDAAQDIAKLHARIKKLEEECNWLEYKTRAIKETTQGEH